ncbi:MAG TPA: hypothetical protein VGD74_12875, partial [Vulgatibacter sp.]
VGRSDEVFVLHDHEGVLRLSTGGTVERTSDGLPTSETVMSLWSTGGFVYATNGSDRSFVFDRELDAWRSVGMLVCPGLLAARDGSRFWQACAGSDSMVWHEADWFGDRALGSIADLAADADGSLIAATARGVHRYSGDPGRWDAVGGGGPTGASTVLLPGGRRLFAGDNGGLWAIAESEESWVRLPGPSLEGWRPFFVVRPEGGIVMGDLHQGGALVEVFVGD